MEPSSSDETGPSNQDKNSKKPKENMVVLGRMLEDFAKH
jgi:hypothetical protein